MWYCVITGKGQRTRELTTTCNGRHRRAGDGLRPEETPKKSHKKEELYDENPEQEDSDRLSGPDDAVVMAVPAFARAEGQYSASSRYYRFHVGDYATFLNLTGNVGATLNMRRLSLYRTNAPGADQNFRRVYVRNGITSGYYYGVNRSEYTGSGGSAYWYMINKDNSAYLNGYNAFLWPVDAQHYEINEDSLFTPHADGEPLKLQNQNLYLTCQSAASNTPVYFATTPVMNWYEVLV